MLHKLFLPLTISAFLATAAASTTPKTTHLSSSSIGVHCNVFTLPVGYDRRPSLDTFADTAIGGLASNQALPTSFVDLRPELSLANRGMGGDFRPYMVAALAMEASSATSGTPSSCYPPLSLATTSVPSATAGASYSVLLSANGGQPPYSWSFGQSSLPQGFSIGSNGDLTGTPSGVGKYTFNVVVSDSLKNNVTGALSLTVVANSTTTTTPPPTTPPPTTPPPTTPPPTTPPPTTPPPTGPATGTALTSCGDITQSGTYYLANDVSSTGTCFGIDANNITLNLNSHMITYGTGGGSTPTPAIENHACTYTTGNFSGGYCGNQAGGAEVYGGNIVQSANSAAFSDVFSFGEGNYSSAPYIHDITATFQNQGAQFYYSAYMTTGARIENNTIYDNVTNIQFPGQSYLSARSAFQGQAIFISGQENNPVTSGDLISGNKIVGSPQGGIRTVDQYSTIINNDVAQNATYSNDWCVEISADHTTATGNNCHPKSGRGINVDANYVAVENNTINVTELPQNMEYGTNGQPGCEGGGAYGIRVEYMTLGNSQLGAHLNDTISGNTITVAANACNAMGFDLIYIPATASGINVINNTITTTNAGQANVQDAGFQFDDLWGNGVTITGNTVSSVKEWMYGYWDGYNDVNVGHNTWVGSPQLTFSAQDGGCDPGITDAGAVCPVSVTITDDLPNTVTCGGSSEATVTIGGQVTVCRPHP